MELITFSCSSCNQVLKVSADNAGKQAKCPRCGAALVIPSSSAAPAPPRTGSEEEVEDRKGRGRPRRQDEYEEEDRPRRSRRREDDYDDEEDDRPRRRRRREDDYEEEDEDRPRPRRRSDRYEDEEDDYDRPRREGMSVRKRWGFVRLGVLLIFISACVLAADGLLEAVANFLVMLSVMTVKDIGTGAVHIIMRIAYGLAFGAVITGLVGYVFGIFVPNKKGTLALAITLLALGGLALVFHILFRIVPMFKDPLVSRLAISLPGLGLVQSIGAGALVLSIFAVLFLYAEFVLAAIFFWAVARSVKARFLAGSWIGIIVLASVNLFLQLVTVILTYVAMRNEGARALQIITAIMKFITPLVFIAFTVWYLLTAWRTRNAIE